MVVSPRKTAAAKWPPPTIKMAHLHSSLSEQSNFEMRKERNKPVFMEGSKNFNIQESKNYKNIKEYLPIDFKIVSSSGCVSLFLGSTEK